MKQYGLWRALWMSFYSPGLYRDVVVNWGGYAILYLLLIITLAWIPLTYQMQKAINYNYATYSREIVEQIPIIHINNGIISTPSKRPYLINHPVSNKRIAVIDTTGKFKTLDDANAQVLLTDVEVITQTKPYEIRKTAIPDNLTMVINPNYIDSIFKQYLSYLWMIMVPFLILITFVYRFIQVLIYSILGKLFSVIISADLSYGQIMSITMVALTPAMFFSTACYFFDIEFPYQFFSYAFITMCYLWFGITVNKGRLPE